MGKLFLAGMIAFSVSAMASDDLFRDLEKDVKLADGSEAPSLSDVDWLMTLLDAPLSNLEKVYIVEFWGTWCGPFVSAIPHLNELQKKYAERVVIYGIAASEKGETVSANMATLKVFVANPETPKQEYFIAYGGPKVKERWLGASFARGIPNAYIVKGGRVIWEGHPMFINDELMGQILSGVWNLEKAKVESIADKVRSVALARVENLLKIEKPNKIKLVAVQEFLGRYPGHFAMQLEEINLLSLLGGTYAGQVGLKMRAIINENSKESAFSRLGIHAAILRYFNVSPNSSRFALAATDEIINLMKSNPEIDGVVKEYAEHFLTLTAKALKKAGRLDEARQHLEWVLETLGHEGNENPSLSREIETEISEIVQSQVASRDCVDGVCSVPSNLGCAEVLK